LEKRPELFEGLDHVWSAFGDLEASRQYGYGHPQALLTSEIEAYARLNLYNAEDSAELVRHLRRLDTIYLDWAAKKAKEKQKAKK